MIHEAGTHDIGLRLRCGRIGSQTNAKTQVIFLVLKSVKLALNQASISVKPETNQSTYAWLLGTLGDDSENVAHLKSELAFFQSSSRLLQLAYFVNCRRPLLGLIPIERHIQVQKRERILSWLVYVLHKTWNWAFSRRSRAVTVKKCTKKVCCTCSYCFAY